MHAGAAILTLREWYIEYKYEAGQGVLLAERDQWHVGGSAGRLMLDGMIAQAQAAILLCIRGPLQQDQDLGLGRIFQLHRSCWLTKSAADAHNPPQHEQHRHLLKAEMKATHRWQAGSGALVHCWLRSSTLCSILGDIPAHLP